MFDDCDTSLQPNGFRPQIPWGKHLQAQLFQDSNEAQQGCLHLTLNPKRYFRIKSNAKGLLNHNDVQMPAIFTGYIWGEVNWTFPDSPMLQDINTLFWEGPTFTPKIIGNSFEGSPLGCITRIAFFWFFKLKTETKYSSAYECSFDIQVLRWLVFIYSKVDSPRFMVCSCYVLPGFLSFFHGISMDFKYVFAGRFAMVTRFVDEAGAKHVQIPLAENGEGKCHAIFRGHVCRHAPR